MSDVQEPVWPTATLAHISGCFEHPEPEFSPARIVVLPVISADRHPCMFENTLARVHGTYAPKARLPATFALTSSTHPLHYLHNHLG